MVLKGLVRLVAPGVGLRVYERITPERIVMTVSERWGVKSEALCGKRRTQSVALPRQVAMYLMRECTGLSLVKIGETFAKGDHGGAFETSLMMAAAPQMVRERERISLAPIDGLVAAMKKGAKTFADGGGEDAYFGDPTAASAEEGEAYFESLAEILSLSIMEHLGSKA